MKRYSFLAGIVLAAAMLFSGCSQGSAPVDPGKAQAKNYTADSSLLDKYTVTEYKVKFDNETASPGDIGLSCITAFGNSIYYSIYELQHMGQRSVCTEVYRIDTVTGQKNKVCRIDGGPHWLNELTATENALFWVIIEGSETRIERYDFEKGTIGVIKAFSLESKPSISLCANQDYVTWFEYAKGTPSLYSCSRSGNDVRLISDSISSQSEFTRAYIKGGLTAFRETKNGIEYFCIYNLGSRSYLKQIRIPDKSPAVNLQADNEFVVWQDSYGWEKNSVYSYSLKNDKLERIIQPASGIDVFSFDLMGDLIFINERQSNQILVRTLSGNGEAYLTKKLSGDHIYVLCSAVENSGFIAYDMKKAPFFLSAIPKQNNKALIHVKLRNNSGRPCLTVCYSVLQPLARRLQLRQRPRQVYCAP